jgi:hypothetical protein
MHYGVWPTGEIDHLDGDPSNNRIENLRDSTHLVNMQNRRRANIGSKTGVLGVKPHGKRFRATIETDRRGRHLGVFDTVEAAHAAYVAAKRIIHIGGTL